VVQSKKKAEIQEEAKRLAGGSHDPRKMFPHYQTAKRIVKENLSEEEKLLFEEEVKDWKAKGIPREVQAEYVFGTLRCNKND
jgi:hypothetical protein